MRFKETELLLLYLIFDLTILNISIYFVCFLGNHFGMQVPTHLGAYFLHANLSWLITFFLFAKRNLYLRDGFENRFIRITKRTFIFVFVSVLIAFIVMPELFSRLFLLKYTLLFYLGKIVFYWFLYQCLKYRRKQGKNVKNIIIVGVNDTSRLLRTVVENNYMLGYNFVGYLSRHSENNEDVIGHPDDLAKIIKESNIDMVFVVLSLFSQSSRGSEFLKTCNGLGVKLRFIPENQSWFKSKANLESVGNLVILNPQAIPMDDISARITKRAFDILFSSLVIVCLFSWLFPIMAILIKLSSQGPVFFVQKRTGINNKEFGCLKFRSMKPNDEANTRQATANDDRITPIGHFIRKTNIDELPQFFNVLLGQMSVVGPRPHMLKHTVEYSRLIDHYMVRHYVKPGITGWAQVNGYRGETDELWKMEKRVEFDMDYIENWNVMWDIRIVWLTACGKRTYLNAR